METAAWVQAIATGTVGIISLAALAYAHKGVNIGRRATQIAHDEAELNKRIAGGGSLISILEIVGKDVNQGYGIAIYFMNNMNVHTKPKILSAHLTDSQGVKFAETIKPYIISKIDDNGQATEYWRPAESLVIYPSDSDRALGIEFGPFDPSQLREASNGQGLGEHAVALPIGTELRVELVDATGPSKFSIPVDEYPFVHLPSR